MTEQAAVAWLARLIERRHIYRQAEVAVVYAMLINMHEPGDVEFWTKINGMVTQRWPKGLERVKRLAWRYFDGSERVPPIRTIDGK